MIDRIVTRMTPGAISRLVQSIRDTENTSVPSSLVGFMRKPIIDPAIPTLVPIIASQMGASNPSLRMIAGEVIQALVKHVDPCSWRKLS
ncbi:hypothetical protein BASA62_003054 [Batrachochytrium salamandrivorans]|nr:hypothetical protein BASA62_003054 [Batrachochytrium salamandrivorans]